MDYKYLNKIDSPSDLKQLPCEALPDLCNELRDFIIHELSHNPGHLASSLGTVELTVALHYIFDTPKDKLIWDVGHQAYAHKILTGRRERFHTNRQFKGLAPFPTPSESEYDAFVAGHASNSISAALGIEIAEEIKHNRDTQAKSASPNVVAIIGDGAMTGGLAFEGINNTSMDRNNLLIILNDNNMAIDPIKGGFTQYLVDITTSKSYNQWRWRLYRMLVKLHLIDKRQADNLRRFSNNLKTILTRQSMNIFQSMNIRYFGPADGHNVEDLVRIIGEIKNYEGPKVLHIITKKGKGYEPAETNQTIWHAPGIFDVETGERLLTGNTSDAPLWQDVFGNQLLELARRNANIVGITPAMPTGCSMNIMQHVFPERVFDVGIAEGHAVTFSAGLAKEGVLPYCNIYSSFMQRAYDNIIHDVALQNLHVVFCIDRAGIVGNDGATHHGLLDMAYLRPIPNMQICAPMTKEDLEEMMQLAETLQGPVAIRYPRGKSSFRKADIAPVEYGKGVQLREGNDVAVLSIGAIGNTVNEAIDWLTIDNAQCTVAHWNMRWLKPIDTNILDFVGTHYKQVVTIEDGMISGGLGSAVLEYCADKNYTCHVTRLGVRDQFVEHGSPAELYHLLKLDKKGVCESLLQVPGK
ncbi:MAG: 1-deoxy-D-xylulose-5-phosphate synthase [Paludibacteraceae bacterium]|nr:1-deoxy-D-xylulose-5-phosphate synthase [Paludibacteraceae bacterium]